MKAPVRYSQEVADRICAGLAEGKSLRAVCSEEGMPKNSTVFEWLEDPNKQDFAEQYARARLTGYRLLADEILEISDNSANDTYIDDDGVERTNHESVNRSKLRVDSRKWMLSKMLPKVYGERVAVDMRARVDVRDLSTAEILDALSASGAIASQAGADESDAVH